MAITATVQLSTTSYAAGATPVPTCSVLVANSSAVAVVVTGLDVYFTDFMNNPVRAVVSPIVPPVGIGQNVTVPAAGTLLVSYMSLALGSAANANQFQAVPPSAPPSNPEGAMPTQSQLFVHARVFCSDGSITEASPAALLLSYTVAPPVAFQGGFAVFSLPNDACLMAVII